MTNASQKILVAVTGGIAAYKSAAIVSQLAQAGHDVCVVMSPAAERFVGAASLAALAGKPVVTDLFDTRFPLGAHIELARTYDTLCVAPATAHFLAAAAQGHSNDLISTLYLCFTGQVWIAPAMNCEMWDHAAVQRNVSQLESDGVKMIGPEEGWLSCRVKGLGRMAEPDSIVAAMTE
jgi:phosphopantothenoylcysteine decarboxylase/phosphopantothenate--cysteine ligase